MKEKSPLHDKWDAYKVKKPGFVHDGIVSMRDDNFHLKAGYVYDYSNNSGSRFGVDKRQTRISSYGISVDGHNIGKSTT